MAGFEQINIGMDRVNKEFVKHDQILSLILLFLVLIKSFCYNTIIISPT